MRTKSSVRRAARPVWLVSGVGPGRPRRRFPSARCASSSRSRRAARSTSWRARSATSWARPGPDLVVENRPGASGMIGAEVVARATADGHTLMIVSNTFATLPALRSDSADRSLQGFGRR